MQKIQKLLSAFILMAFLMKMPAQDLKYRKMYQEKTLEIKEAYDTINKFNTLNVFPSFVEYRLYTKPLARYHLHDSGFASKTADIDSNYIFYPKNAKIIKGYFDYKVTKKISRFTKMKRPFINSNDSAILVKELHKIKKVFKDSLIENYYISDSLYNVLRKYPAENHILFDILFFQNNVFYSKTYNHWALTRMFVFDMNKKRLIYYNYNIESGGWRYDYFSNSDVPTFSINPLLRYYKHSLKKNSRHL